ncbi:MAG: short chain dehydrogenase [Legionellales bacterium]|nr:short chain dehydrogenase [Legionellales bacterium]
MKIIIIGGTGTIGKAVINELSPRHEIICVGQSHGDIQVDISDITSIQSMYAKVNDFDAVILTTGKVHFGDLKEMQAKEYEIGLKNKLMGQINVVLEGMKKINNNGSFTLTSGIINRDPIQLGTSAAMVNGALDAFVKSAAIEMPKGIRINCVSPTVVTESLDKYAPFFRGFEPASAERTALAYAKSVEGLQTGQVICL